MGIKQLPLQLSLEQRLLLEISKALSRLLRDLDRTQFPPDKDWAEHQKHAWRLDFLAQDLEKGTDHAEMKIQRMEQEWK
jgi:hypothetical protein